MAKKTDKEAQKQIILAALETFIEEHDRVPSQKELAEAAGVTRQRVAAVLKEVEATDMTEEALFKALTPSVILAIQKSAKRGNATAQKLWLQYMEKFAERSEIKQTVTVEHSVAFFEQFNNFLLAQVQNNPAFAPLAEVMPQITEAQTLYLDEFTEAEDG